MSLTQSEVDLDSKNDITEQLEFTDNIVIAESLPEFVDVNYVEDGTIGIEVKNEFYNMDTASTITIQEVEPEKESTKLDVAKLKYPCSKCDESFALKIDLKVSVQPRAKHESF